eukprot:scaffold6708_cov134-Cylindrotheca_fusiformis.AAC.12
MVVLSGECCEIALRFWIELRHPLSQLCLSSSGCTVVFGSQISDYLPQQDVALMVLARRRTKQDIVRVHLIHCDSLCCCPVISEKRRLRLIREFTAVVSEHLLDFLTDFIHIHFFP